MLRIRPLGPADLALGMRLKEQAGWNQTEADWTRFLELEPEGCFVVEWDGVAVATTTTCVFGPVAWVAMVLVEAAYRGRGIGTALMRNALEFLDQRGVRTVRLDATPLGQPVYEKLGFCADYELQRWQGILPSGTGGLGVTRAREDEVANIAELDQRATGTDRRKLFERLLHDGWGNVIRRAARIDGCLFIRPGARAFQVGPVIAGDARDAAWLFTEAGRLLGGGAAYLDIPTVNEAAVQFVRSHGLVVQRRLLRMTRGPGLTERLDMLWASSRPEKG